MKFAIPDNPDPILNSYGSFMARDEYIAAYGFVYLSWNWLNPLIKYLQNKKCLEVMAGRGHLSYVLKEKGIDVITTDNMSWHNGELYKNTWGRESWTDIEHMDAISAVKKYGKNIDVVIMSWPPYEDNTAYKLIKEMYDINPNAIIMYIGESGGGCNADDDFFMAFQKIQSMELEEISEQYFDAQWRGIHDEIVFGRYSPH
jgi:hypothetical protein